MEFQVPRTPAASVGVPGWTTVGRSLCRAMSVGALAAALSVSGAGIAAADAQSDAEARRARVQAQIAAAQNEVESASTRLAHATTEYQQVSGKLPAALEAQKARQAEAGRAQAALAEARAAAAQAQGEADRAAAVAAAALAEWQAATARVDSMRRAIDEKVAQIDGRRSDLGRVAAKAYQGGGAGTLNDFMDLMSSESVDELNTLGAQMDSAMQAQKVVLQEMQDERAKLANQRAGLVQAEADAYDAKLRADGAQQQAEAALASARQYEGAASASADAASAAAAAAAEATRNVQVLVDRKARVVAVASSERANDQAQYQQLTREGARLDALIADLARQARERARREAAARAAAARAAAERAAAERAAAARAAAEQAAAAQAAAERAAAVRNQATAASTSGSTSSAGKGSGIRVPVTQVPTWTAPSSVMTFPVPGAPITSAYGMRFHPVLHVWKIHDGLDFGAGCGTPIHAARSGRVAWATYLTGYGSQVLLDHGIVEGDSVMTSYSHLQSWAVYPGQWVERGQVIGYVGTSGFSTGCHLHLMVYQNGVKVDPGPWVMRMS